MSYKRLDNDQCFRDLDPYFKGLDENADGTFGCDGYPGCLYLQNGRCIYNIAPIRQDISRGCYEDNRMADIEAANDLADWY